MVLLHTSDWHLGQKFIGQSRDPEHERALDWLLQTIVSEKVEVLIVAGDIFDVNNPPVSAEALYYRFLARLLQTTCRHIVIIGGNHDSPTRLEAPKKLLHALGIHIVGCATDQPQDEIIVLRDANNQPEAIVAAVPFLRDKDFKISLSGESTEARVNRIKTGIYEHYTAVAALAGANQQGNIPVIATGHLYAKGASSSGEQNNIYIGNLENITAEQFPEIFDYIALGHIHRPQKVGKKNHIRYCGSLIPLSFSEISDKKQVLICNFEAGKGLLSVQELHAPIFRKLITLRGSLAEVEANLIKTNDQEAPLPAWVEIIVEGDPGIAGLDKHLRDAAAGMNLEILKIRNERRQVSLDEAVEAANLDALTPEEVFRKRCETMGIDASETEELINTFRELQEWMLLER
jgi:exonuclease SbcD